MKIIDACGLSCPEPILMLKNGMKGCEEDITLLVDNKTSVETCSRYAESQGYVVTVQAETKPYEIVITK